MDEETRRLIELAKVARGALMPWAGVLATLVPQLQQRLRAARDARQAAAAAAVAAAVTEQAETDRVLVQARHERREQLARRVGHLPMLFVLPGHTEPMTGSTLASLISGTEDAARLDTIETVVAQAEAAFRARQGATAAS